MSFFELERMIRKAAEISVSLVDLIDKKRECNENNPHVDIGTKQQTKDMAKEQKRDKNGRFVSKKTVNQTVCGNLYGLPKKYDKYVGLWFLRDFDYYPAPMDWYIASTRPSDDFLKGIDSGRFFVFNTKEDAIAASEKVRALLSCEDKKNNDDSTVSIPKSVLDSYQDLIKANIAFVDEWKEMYWRSRNLSIEKADALFDVMIKLEDVKKRIPFYMPKMSRKIQGLIDILHKAYIL